MDKETNISYIYATVCESAKVHIKPDFVLTFLFY